MTIMVGIGDLGRHKNSWGFAHIYPDRVEVFGTAAVQILTRPLRGRTRRELLEDAVVQLAAVGLSPAAEGWRAPLDPKVGILATCAVPVPDAWGEGRRVQLVGLGRGLRSQTG